MSRVSLRDRRHRQVAWWTRFRFVLIATFGCGRFLCGAFFFTLTRSSSRGLLQVSRVVLVSGVLKRVIQMAEVSAFDITHRVVVDASLGADLIDGNDIAMLQLGGGPSFVLKSLDDSLIQHAGERQYLDRDSFLKRDLFGFIDDAHAASPDFAKQFVVTQLLFRGQLRIFGAAVGERFGCRVRIRIGSLLAIVTSAFVGLRHVRRIDERFVVTETG